jgi:hypothetical protein
MIAGGILVLAKRNSIGRFVAEQSRSVFDDENLERVAKRNARVLISVGPIISFMGILVIVVP